MKRNILKNVKKYERLGRELDPRPSRLSRMLSQLCYHIFNEIQLISLFPHHILDRDNSLQLHGSIIKEITLISKSISFTGQLFIKPWRICTLPTHAWNTSKSSNNWNAKEFIWRTQFLSWKMCRTSSKVWFAMFAMFAMSVIECIGVINENKN